MNKVITKFKLNRADNARHFKHKDGGKAFVNGVSVLDSNSDAYKYVKKKYKMRSALNGTKLDTALNSNTGKFIINGISQLYTGILNSMRLSDFINEDNKRIAKLKKAIINNVGDNSLLAIKIMNQLKQLNQDVNFGSIDLGQILKRLDELARLKNIKLADLWELNLLLNLKLKIDAIQGSGYLEGVSDLLSLINNMTTTNNTVSTTTNNVVANDISAGFNLFTKNSVLNDPNTFWNLR